MRLIKIIAVVLLLAVPTLSQAAPGDIPGDSTWYFHADFDAMRKGKAGKGLYDWLDREVFAEIRDETGVDFSKEVSYLTAFSAQENGPVIVIDGKISQESKDKLLAVATGASGDLQVFKSSGKEYFYFDGETDGGDIDIDIESLEDEAYVSLALKNKIVITHKKEQMEKLLANNGKLPPVKNAKNALFVLHADRALMQAGADTSAMQGQSEGDWDSNILRNTKQVGVLLADLGDQLGFEAQLVTTAPEMANSLASIVRGLISLTAFNDEVEPEVASVLQSTTVDVADNMLKIALKLDPDTVVAALDN
jgi:hypothetical protein